MYKCLECGHIFEEGEQASWQEYYGEYWGQPCYEWENGCPLCHGVYERTVQCKVCHSHHLHEELYGGICEECREENEEEIEDIIEPCEDVQAMP